MAHGTSNESGDVHVDELPRPVTLTPRQMLEEREDVNVLAPLVRCSKLPFRHLASIYETHITHTPMILAEEFSRSQIARTADFSTSRYERGVYWMRTRDGKRRKIDDVDERDEAYFSSLKSEPLRCANQIDTSYGRLPSMMRPPGEGYELTNGILMAQFASPNGKALADAVELISTPVEGVEGEKARLVDGVDLNCGCPQPWAFASGIGSGLLRKPEIVADMVRAVKDRMGWDYNISVKIRVDPDLKLTERLVQTAIHAGASHLTIHGRTRHQASTQAVSLPSIKFAVDAARGEVPCVGNGDIWELDDVMTMRRETGVRGVMAARGLLANPALFAGYSSTPKHAVENFVRLTMDYSLIYPLFHRHVSYMLEGTMNKYERLYFNSLDSHVTVVDYLQLRGLNF
ncbi:tRNA dihydrouridine synthase [Naganishia albida]|nr:tRNA dihydrouridine synthase [Naganishia albida]